LRRGAGRHWSDYRGDGDRRRRQVA
jgi:hypothetical protein